MTAARGAKPRPASSSLATAARALAVVALSLTACAKQEPGVADTAAEHAGRVRFDDVTREAGVEHRGQTYDAAVGDFDGDGHADLFVGNHANPSVLLRSDGHGRFTDVLPGSGIEPSGDHHGAGFADFDNDGKLDLFVSLGAGRGLATKANHLYRGLGGNRFEDVAAKAGVTDPHGRSRSVAWLDFDRDGFLDLLIANSASPNRLFRNLGNGTFEDVSRASGIEDTTATRVAWGDVDGDGFSDVLLSGGTKNLVLLHNDEGVRFRDVTADAGLASPGGWVQGMALGDFDADGRLDLAASFGADFTEGAIEMPDGDVRFTFFGRDDPAGLDFEQADPSSDGVEIELYENGSPFDPSRIRCGSEAPAQARFRCTSTAAVNTAQKPELPVGFLVWRDVEKPTWHIRWVGAGDHHLSGIVHGGRHAQGVGLKEQVGTGVALWRGAAGGTFTRADVLPPVVKGINGQGLAWADVDNDGWLDLYLVDSGRDGAGARNVLLLGDGGKSFVAVSPDRGASPSSEEGRGVGAQFLDVDEDGRLDLFLTNGWGAPPFDRGPYRLLHNVSEAGHWLDVGLVGERSNRQGLGARIEVSACGRSQVRWNDGAANYFSQSAERSHFGLGTCDAVERVTVRWPAGEEQVVENVRVDQVLRISEGAK